MKYTNFMLTLIAIALLALVLQQIQPAEAGAADCGNSKLKPCYVRVIGSVSVK